jgi:hypothetical protein
MAMENQQNFNGSKELSYQDKAHKRLELQSKGLLINQATRKLNRKIHKPNLHLSSSI